MFSYILTWSFFSENQVMILEDCQDHVHLQKHLIFAFVALHKVYVLRKHKCGKIDTPDRFSGSAFPVQGHRTGA